jgi:prophage regulatory protein
MQRRRPNLTQADRRKVTGMDDLFDRVEQPMVLPPNEEFWNVRAISVRTGLARSTIYRYVQAGYFPRQRHLGPGRVGWLASEVRKWMATRPDQSKLDNR